MDTDIETFATGSTRTDHMFTDHSFDIRSADFFMHTSTFLIVDDLDLQMLQHFRGPPVLKHTPEAGYKRIGM